MANLKEVRSSNRTAEGGRLWGLFHCEKRILVVVSLQLSGFE